jgi:putative ABC transport system permease protein
MIPLSYNVRSILVRRTTTAAAVIGIALVVFVLASTLMLSAGIQETLARGGGRDSAIVIRKGSDNELSSIIDQGKVSTILAAPGVKKSPDGQPIGTGDVAMIVMLTPTSDPGGLSNVQMRGVSFDALPLVRPRVKVIEGRLPTPGSDEAMVGRAIAGRFQHLTVGDTIEPKKNRPLKVVGVFEDGGSAWESEVWADVDTTRSAFGREGLVSSVRVSLASPADFDQFEANIEADKRLGLEAMTDDQWTEKQSNGLMLFVTILGGLTSAFFAIGAMIGAMNTMYASIANRQKEIGTLRAIGFRRRHVLLSFVLESILIALIGGALGSLAALTMTFARFSMLNFATFSEMVFRFHPTPQVFLISFVFAAAMGLVGGLLPAIRAARMPPVQAMRN